jgi:Protein of unknown function (DUF1592)/Protein of unknown function (DUF1588)/Protein of unknown function (DUF1587)/Protein of unknown function (DUF1585)/Protein of unknown function (DUF1595)
LQWTRHHRAALVLAGIATCVAWLLAARLPGRARAPEKDLVDGFAQRVRPLLKKYCLECHSTKVKKASLDLERFTSLAEVRKGLKTWQMVVEQLEAGEMPPQKKPQPTLQERTHILHWATGLLNAEARARAGDPGPASLRRLSNTEYDCTIRDLTGVDLRPTREFPADGAAGEGFTNAAEALSDITPDLFSKYLEAAKDIAAHAVLLPDGFRFEPGKTRRDWTDGSLARLRKFYAVYTSDGRLPLLPYVLATVRYREALSAGEITLAEVAAKEKINPKYLAVLWQTLNDRTPSYPLDLIRARWRQASEQDVAGLVTEIMAWQKRLWKFVPIGSCRYGNTTRQVANDPRAAEVLAWTLALAPAPSPAPVLASEPALRELVRGYTAFRRCFPWFLCFPQVVPTDEAVCLKMFHREDEPLERLFLDTEQKRHLDHLWSEHRFISQQPVAENNYLPQFIGFVTQDQPKELLDYFESQRPVFHQRAEEFEKEGVAAIPRQWAALLEFAARALRRPLGEKEKSDLHGLYKALRSKGAAHEEAFRGVVARVLVSPTFLFRLEKPPPGIEAGPVSDWELATRLSYFLWSSLPDEELRRLAAAGKLHEPELLADQTRRLLQDRRLRALATEFGTQWIHVRNFDQLKEKNEKLFPDFDAKLRAAIYEESIWFFQDLFQSDRPVTDILDADYAFLNETLARHYGIPGVTGQHWRRVEGVRKFGRGGILGLASVQATQSGASRTSPVLRGNWVVETLFGEKLPRPPDNVPILPDVEGGTETLTTRQQVEKHASVASCAVCHVRIDPFGFAFEQFDAIGRWRVKDLGGRAIDATATLKDGTTFQGIDGLRNYLLTTKKDVIVRLFCQKLLGYALGRTTTLADRPLIDEMVTELNMHQGRVSAAVLTIVRSPQFRMIRGQAAAHDD